MTLEPAALAALPLRERKRARTRVGLWRALRDRIEHTPFTDITVRELAAAVEISEPTFFAHFASKTELLAYHICLWRIETVLASASAPDGAAFLRRFFAATAASVLAGPRMWFEITGEVARGGGLCAVLDVGAAERLLVFGTPAALDVAIVPQGDLFAGHLAVAAGRGELTGPVDAAVTALLAGFYGVPLALGESRLAELEAAYSAHLDQVLT
ncbi:TetR/AcrR family transcriptional regulator [Longispora urticae]